MKKKILAYFSGVFATVLVLTMVTTALAASGKATFNFVNVSLRGERKIAAGADITVANGQKVPSSILYTDEKGGPGFPMYLCWNRWQMRCTARW